MKRGRRFGGVPPIVTVLITISAVVAAGLVAWFMYTSTRSAASQPILEVTNAVYVGAANNWRISITVRNLGGSTGASASLPTSNSGVLLFCDGFTNWVTPSTVYCSPSSIRPGESATCVITGTTAISPSGGRLSCQLQLPSTSAGLVLSFVAVQP